VMKPRTPHVPEDFGNIFFENSRILGILHIPSKVFDTFFDEPKWP